MSRQKITKQGQANCVKRYSATFGVAVALLMMHVNADAGASSLSVGEPKTYDINQTSIVVNRQHSAFILKLESNPSTGYSWSYHENRFSKNNIILDKHYYKASNKNLIGAPGYEYWQFHVSPKSFNREDSGKLTMVYARPWEKGNAASTVNFLVKIENIPDDSDANFSGDENQSL